MKKKYMLVVIASAVLASCSSDVAVVTPSQENVALGVKVNVLGAETKAIIEGELFAENTPIGVVLASDNGYTPSVVAYTQQTTGGVWGTTGSLYLSSNPASIYGFYPCEPSPAGALTPVAETDVDLTNNKLLKVKVSESTDFKGTLQNDYMYATAKAENGTYTPITATNAADKKTVNLWLHHALSKLTFKLNKDATYPGTCKVSKVVLQGTAGAPFTGFKTGTAGTMKLSDGSIEGLETSATITLTAAAVTVQNQEKKIVDVDNVDYGKVLVGTDATTKFFIQALVAPIALPIGIASESNGIKLTLTVKSDSGEKEMSVLLPNNASLTNWEAGKNYAYSISIGATALTVNQTVSIVKWGDVVGADGLIVN